MKSTHLFEQLNGRVVYMDEIKEILEQAKKDNNTDVIYRLSKTLEDCEDEDRVRINIKEYPQQLNAPRHTGDYREALDECGRLRKGWYFKGGKVLRAEKKVDKKINKTKTKNTPKKNVKEIKSQEEKTEKTEKKPVFIAKMIQPGEYIFFGENQWAKRQDAYFEAIAQKYNLETKAVRQLNELVTDTIWRKAYSFENETVGSFGWENYRLMLKNNLLKKVGEYVKLTKKGKEIGQLLSSWSQKNPAPKMLKEMYSKRQEIAYYNAEDLEDFKKLNAKEYGVWQVEKFEEKSEKTDTQPKAEEPTTPHEITFYSDYKLGTNRFAITDENGAPLWYGKDFDAPSSQAQGELNAGKKAVWLAGKVREMFDLPSIKLTLNVDAQWLTYQSDPKQKGYELTRLAEKYNVILDVNWVNGEDNPADAYTTKNASGYQKWSDVSIDEFRVLIKQKGGLSAPCEGLTKREISKIAKEETDKVLKMNIWEFSDMPDALIEEIKTWKIISKSPYSHSYYNDACKSWNYTTEGSLRVSDHWNFVSWGETHCPTNVPVKDMNWILAQYKDGVYHVIKDYGRASKSEMKKREELEGIYRAFIEYQELKEQEENLNKIAKTIKSLGIKIENYKDTKKDKTKLWDDIKNAFIKKKKPQMTIVKGIYKGSGSRAKRVGSEKYYGTLVSLTNEFATIDKNITSKEFSFDNKKIRDLFHNLKYNYLEVFRKHILEKKAGLKGTEANIPTDQENTQKSGLSAPNPLIIPMNTERPEVELFNIGGDFGQFLGDVERKPIGSVAITLDAPQGAGKTRFLFYAMNQIAGAGYRCLFVSLEEHPMSELFQQKKEKYIDPQNLHLIDTIGELPNGYDDLKDVIDHYDWIFIDSWGKLSETTPVDFDRDFRKKYNGKGLFVIFQRTVNNTMRGGSRFQFDGDIIMKIHKDKDGDFKNNYAYFDKNRYQSTELHLLKFNTYTHKLMIDE